MFANTPFYPGYPQSQAPNTSGMNASPAPIPDHSQLNLPQPGPMTGSFDPSLGQQFPNGKPKRKQVKNACTNCQKACKKCDDQRPCPRCVKYGQTETCVDSVRKERQKGLKRGPYKKRKQGDVMEGNASGAPSNIPVSGLPNGMYPTPTTGAYQNYGNAAGQFENFNQFQHGHYLQQYNLLNNMSNIIQQAAANANAKDQQQQQQNMNGGNNNNDNNNDNKAPTEVDENGKLNILSQLCTAVLDRDPNATEASAKDDQIKPKTESTSSEPYGSQSNTHSRESTNTTTDTPTVTDTATATETTITTTTNNNEPSAESKQSAPENPDAESENDDDRGSRYGTPEAGVDQDTGKNN